MTRIRTAWTITAIVLTAMAIASGMKGGPYYSLVAFVAALGVFWSAGCAMGVRPWS